MLEKIIALAKIICCPAFIIYY